MAVDWKKVGQKALGFVTKTGNALGAEAIDFGAQIASGYVSDYFNQRSENRADARNRKMIVDSPQLQVEGRRKAGLNPYTLEGAQLPGMSAQSQTDTSSNADFLNDVMMQERFAIEKDLAKSQINKENALANEANAKAESIRNEEKRTQESWEYKLQEFIQNLRNGYLKNEMLEIELDIAEYTKPNRMAMSDRELMKADYDITQQIMNISLTEKTIQEKEENIKNLIEQRVLLQLQQSLARAGYNLTLAQTKEAYARIKNMAADTNLKNQQAGYYKELAFLTDAQKENQVIQNVLDDKYGSKRERQKLITGYVDSFVGNLSKVSNEALKWVGALATGGVSAGASSIVGASVADAPAGMFDAYGNPIR